MRIRSLDFGDVGKLAAFQPPDWDDLPGGFGNMLGTPYADPVKGEVEGAIVAVGAILYHADTAWLAKIVVHPDQRNRGYGKALTRGLIDRVDRTRYRTVYLDATDLGYPVYRALGFEEEVSYVHFFNPNLGGGQAGSFRQATACDEGALLELDLWVYGEDRRQLLADHWLSARVVEVEGVIQAAYFPSLLNGPILARHVEFAQPLVLERLRSFDKAQLPVSNRAGVELLGRLGCTEVRRSRRMFLGERRPWRAEAIFNRTSGKLG